MARLDELIDVTILVNTEEKITRKPLPQLRDKQKLPIFFNKAFVFNRITYFYVDYNLRPRLENANRLIIFLKNEYNIKE